MVTFPGKTRQPRPGPSSGSWDLHCGGGSPCNLYRTCRRSQDFPKVLGQGIHHLLVTTTVRPTVGRHLHLEASIGRSDLMELHCFISKKGKEKGKAGQQGEGKRRAHHPPLRKIRTHRVIPTLDVTLILSH